MEQDFEFDNQRPDEKIILLEKRHPWVLARHGILVLLILLIVLVAFLIWGAILVSFIFLIIGLVFIVLLGLGRWFVYANDIFILTNQRIINIDQSGFFTRRVAEAELENIQNISYEIRGPIKSFLNFGDVLVSTAGDNNPGLVLKNVQNPHFVQEKLIAYQKKAQEKGGSSFANKNIIR